MSLKWVRRPDDEIPGSQANLDALGRLLNGWHCCGSPNLCGAKCQDDELSATLAQAAQVVCDELARRRG